MKLTRKVIIIAVFCVSGLFLSHLPLEAKTIFKDGDVIRIIVPFSPGGGYDQVCRLMAPFYEAELEKITGVNLTAIIVNVTGAGGVKGYSQMFRAKPDGKTVGMIGLSAAPYQQLETEHFDLNKFNYLAVVNDDPTLMAVGKDLPINSFAELIKRSLVKPVLMSTSGKGSAEHIEVLLTQALLAEKGVTINFDFIHYQGSAPAFLAIIKGEAEAKTGSESPAYPHVKNGDIKPIAIYSRNRGKLLPDTPTLLEQNVPNADVMSSVLGQIRIMVAPPGLDGETSDLLAKAMFNSLRNPKLVQQAKALKIPIDADSGVAAKDTSLKRLNNAIKYQELILSSFK